ncbi:MAG: ferric reductase-like transmembrane domain-containing protein [Methylobacillus sp.]|jgi:predicted ferric reductase|nr:ferric reductase-like transmembrane domain-containing protein [Methylobacillus sp.]
MRNLKLTFWGGLLLLAALWVAAEPAIFQAATFMDWRKLMVQLTGIIAVGCMGFAIVLALRPRRLEKWLAGLDKMYRLHKWLGISALVFGIMHWLWAKGPKWAVEWGWMERQAKGKRLPPDNVIEAFLTQFRHTAESVGEWAFYAIVALIVLALLKWFPYRWFYKTHRLMALAFLAFAFHAVVLFKFSYWASPLGVLIAALVITGVVGAFVSLAHRIGQSNKVQGEIVAMRYFPGVHALSIETTVSGWPGHAPGQFVFATSSESEGAHPYTIASGWDPQNPRLMFVVKELGDHTNHLREKLKIGQKVTIEGPYGCFTFDDDRPRQIWIGGGIGITPFIARMQTIAGRAERKNQTIDLFHTTADVDEDAFGRLKADAQSADVRLHLTIDDRDGYLTAANIRNLVPDWREASIWFCGPAAFGETLKRDFAAQGFPVEKHFHQEMFSMR